MKGILEKFDGSWEDLADALEKLVDEAKQGRRQDDATGLDSETQAPFFDLLQHEAVGEEKLDGQARDDLCALTVELVDHIGQEIGIVGFWSRAQKQNGLRNWIFMTLDRADLLPFAQIDPVADKLMELAKANHRRLVR